MVASREAMNMGARSSNVISELKSVISLLGQATDSAFQKVTSGISRTSSFNGSGTNVSNSLVAPNPVFNAPPITYLTETGSGLVASGPSSSLVARGAGSNLSEYAAQSGAGSTYQSEGGSVVARGAGSGGGNRLFGGGGGGGGGGSGGNTSATSASNQGWGNIPGVGTLIGTAFGMYNVGANLTSNTSDVLESQLLQQRASFYAGTGSSSEGIITVQGNQRKVANSAMLSGDNPQMDVMRAQIAAQGYGLGYGTNDLLKSAANVSNLMPGLGVEGSVRATGAMQQAYNVNMLRGIGIQLRGADGTLKGPDAVIEDVWKKICRDYSQSGQGKAPSLKEVQISLQPGNALDSMLNQYFGNDPMLKQLVANGLLFKAQGGLSFNAKGEGIMQSEVSRLGGTTGAMKNFTSTAAAGQGFLVAGQGSASEGYRQATGLVSDYYSKATAMAALVLQKALGDTLLTAFGGNPLATMVGVGAGQNVVGPEKLASLMNLTDPMGVIKSIPGVVGDLFGSSVGLLGLLKDSIPFLATGGPVTSGSPYVVGEKGPEFFVPSTNGTVVPNDQLKTGGSFTYNFTINAASGNTQDLVTEIKSVLVQLETNRKVSES
jgi:hypothetical protein